MNWIMNGTPKKKILITGISSFIGYNLGVYFADSAKYEVFGTISKNFSEYSGIELERISDLERIKLIQLNLKNHEAIADFIRAEKPNFWINHAGYATNYDSFDYNWKNGLEINVSPLFKLYKALSENDCEGVIITGSNAEYSNSEIGNKETSICIPSTPYGMSKLLETLTAEQLSLQYNIPTRIARVFIPFGKFDNSQKLLPYTISKLIKNETVDLSLCLQQRDFIYIKDLVKIYESLINDCKQGGFEIFNVASGNPTRLRDILILISKILDKPTELLNFNSRPMKNSEALISYGNIEKLKRKLNFSFTYDIEQAITDYLTHFKRIEEAQ